MPVTCPSGNTERTVGYLGLERRKLWTRERYTFGSLGVKTVVEAVSG